MEVDLPPTSRESELLVGRERLVAEEDDAVLQQRTADFAERLLVDFLRQVDALDLRTQRAGDLVRLDPLVLRVPYDVHGPALPQFSRRSMIWRLSGCNSPFSTRVTMSVSAALAGVANPISCPLRTMKPLRNWISVRRPFTMSWPIDGRCSPPPALRVSASRCSSTARVASASPSPARAMVSGGRCKISSSS